MGGNLVLRAECRVMACAWIEENKGRDDVAFGHWSNDMKSLPMETMKNYKGNPSTFLQSPFIHSHSFMSMLFPSSHTTTTNQRLPLSYSSFLFLSSSPSFSPKLLSYNLFLSTSSFCPFPFPTPHSVNFSPSLPDIPLILLPFLSLHVSTGPYINIYTPSPNPPL